MNPTAKRVTIWSSFIIGLLLLLFGLAKMGTNNAPADVNAALPRAIGADDNTQGNPAAKAVLVEYSDFQCPGCAAYYPIVKRLSTELGDKMLFVYRYYPLRSIHNDAQISAQAGAAAAKQGKFWEMHDMLFNTQDIWDKDTSPEHFFYDYARSLNLNVDQFKTDLTSGAVVNRVNRDYNDATAARLSGTPTFFLNGKLITPPDAYEDFKKLVESAATGV